MTTGSEQAMTSARDPLAAALAERIHAAAFYGSHALSDCACIELAYQVLADGVIEAAIRDTPAMFEEAALTDTGHD